MTRFTLVKIIKDLGEDRGSDYPFIVGYEIRETEMRWVSRPEFGESQLMNEVAKYNLRFVLNLWLLIIDFNFDWRTKYHEDNESRS